MGDLNGLWAELRAATRLLDDLLRLIREHRAEIRELRQKVKDLGGS